MRHSPTLSSSTCAAASLRPTSSCSPSCWPSRSCRTASRLTQVGVHHLWVLCKLCRFDYTKGPSAKPDSHADNPDLYPALLHKALIHSFIHSFVHSCIPVCNMCLPPGSPGAAKVEIPPVAVVSRLCCGLTSTAAFTFLSSIPCIFSQVPVP